MRKLLLPLLMSCCFTLQAQTMLPIKQNGKWGFINQEGKVVITPAYDEAAVFKNGYAVVGINAKKGIIDSTGKLVIPAEYAGAEQMFSGYFALRQEKWSLADLNGNIYGNFRYDIIRSLDYNSIQLIDSGRSYLFHIPTQHLSEEHWDRIEVLAMGKWYAVWKQGKIGVVDHLHKNFIQPIDTEQLLYVDSMFATKSGARYGFFDAKGEPVMPERGWLFYRKLHPEVLVVYDKPSHLTLLNLRDHKLILPDNHQYRVLSEKYIVFVKDHLEGLADWDGTILVPNQYQSISYYKGDGMLRMKKNDKTGVIGPDGKIIIPAEYTYIDPFDKFGRAVAAKGGRMGVLSKTGSMIIPFEYDHLVIDDEFIKGYVGQAMDVYTLNEKGLPEDKMHYNQVQTIQLANRYRPIQPDYFDGRDFNYGNLPTTFSRPVGDPDFVFFANPRYEQLEKPVQYTSQSRIKCIISNNQNDVHKLCGVWDTLRKRRIAEIEFWDIRVYELNLQNYARIIMPGGRQGLISRAGAIKTQFTIKKGTRSVPATISYIGPFRHGLARTNVGGKLLGNSAGGTWYDPRPSLSGYGLNTNGGMWGYVNGDGEMQIPAEYSYLSDFTKGRSIACKENKYGVIDTLNHAIIPLKYDNISYLPETNEQYFRLDRNERRYGLMDSTGHIVLKAEYQSVGYPSEGLVPVMINRLWGFTDMNGTMVIEPAYDMVSPFSEGLAMVKKKGLYGFINHSGQLVVDCKYGSALDLTEGKIAVKLQGKWGYLDKNGKILIPHSFGKASVFHNGLAMVTEKGDWGLIDAQGKWVVHPAYDKITLSDYDGFYRLNKKGDWHLANAHGKILHHVNYESIGEFHEGLAVVKEKARYGYIDTTGKVIIPIHLISAKNFSEGLAAACEKYRLGYIDKTGTFIIESKYRIAGEFHEGIALVIEENNIFAIDRHGNMLWKTSESIVKGYFSEGYALIGRSYYNLSGQPLITGIEHGGAFHNGVAKVNVGHDALINPAGEHLVDFQTILPLKNGYAPCSIVSSYGIADLNGKIILEPNYQKIQLIGSGIFLIENFESIGYINSNGKWIWEPTK